MITNVHFPQESKFKTSFLNISRKNENVIQHHKDLKIALNKYQPLHVRLVVDTDVNYPVITIETNNDKKVVFILDKASMIKSLSTESTTTTTTPQKPVKWQMKRSEKGQLIEISQKDWSQSEKLTIKEYIYTSTKYESLKKIY
eukprot:UN05243